jgi:uncharacterized protein (DUF2336 family)
MIIEKFLGWIESADTNARIAATTALARAYLTSPLELEERCAAEAALTFLLDDPSPKVRHALAEVLSTSAAAPSQIINALAGDQIEIAAVIILRSPVLTDIDLIDRVAMGDEGAQQLIALRPQVSKTVAAAIAEVGCLDACRELVGNSGADIARLSLRRICERHGSDGTFRETLLDDPRLPADCRQSLVKQHGQALSELTLVRALMGQTRAERVTRDACMKACIATIDEVEPEEYGALVEHLRLSGDLTTGFVIRTLAHGKIPFFGAILSSLTEETLGRVENMLSNGREASLKALFVKSGFSDAVAHILQHGLNTWRAVANGRLHAGPQEVSRLMMVELERTRSVIGHANDDLVALLRGIYLDTMRENSRNHALAIAAA